MCPFVHWYSLCAINFLQVINCVAVGSEQRYKWTKPNFVFVVNNTNNK